MNATCREAHNTWCVDYAADLSPSCGPRIARASQDCTAADSVSEAMATPSCCSSLCGAPQGETSGCTGLSYHRVQAVWLTYSDFKLTRPTPPHNHAQPLLSLTAPACLFLHTSLSAHTLSRASIRAAEICVSSSPQPQPRGKRYAWRAKVGNFFWFRR